MDETIGFGLQQSYRNRASGVDGVGGEWVGSLLDHGLEGWVGVMFV